MRQRRLVVDVLAHSCICCCTAVSAHCNPAERAMVGQRVYFDRVGGVFFHWIGFGTILHFGTTVYLGIMLDLLSVF